MLCRSLIRRILKYSTHLLAKYAQGGIIACWGGTHCDRGQEEFPEPPGYPGKRIGDSAFGSVLVNIVFPSKITELTCQELTAVHRCHRSIFRCLKCTRVEHQAGSPGSEHSVPLFKKEVALSNSTLDCSIVNTKEGTS